MDDTFREIFEGLRQAGQGLIAAHAGLVQASEALVKAGDGIVQANEGMQQAIAAALRANDEQEDLREPVRRLESLVPDLVERVKRQNGTS